MSYSTKTPGRRVAWHARSWAVACIALAGCASPGPDPDRGLSTFMEDTTVSGVVLENVTACEVDAVCYLRIGFADTTVVALYGTGERPAPPCEISREVSDVAFPLREGEGIEVVISRCGDEGLYMRELGRDAG